MLSAEVMRLAAIEALRPTASLLSNGPWPTLAKHLVFDSRAVAVDDLGLDAERRFTPVLSVYTRKSEAARRGPGQGSVTRNGRSVLEVTAELAVSSVDDDGSVFADAMADTDPQARIVLAALCAQVRFVLTMGPTAAIFRRIVMAIDSIDEEGFAVPELGLRWQRTTMLFDCQIPDDEFQPGGGLPQPAGSVAALLPENSYAATTLAAMAEQFAAAEVLPEIETIAFAVKDAGLSGQAGESASVGPPFDEVE